MHGYDMRPVYRYSWHLGKWVMMCNARMAPIGAEE